MRVDLLGTLRVVVDGEVVEIAAAKERGLVEILALHAGRPVATDALIDALWGDSPPATARKTLQGYVSRVRGALGAEAIVTEPPGYALDVPRASVDVDRFEALGAEGRSALRSGEVERAFEQLTEALGLWRGRPLVDLPESEAAGAEVTRVEELRLRVVEDLSEARLALGQHEELVPELESLVREHPYREALWSHLMVALYRSGRQRDALRAFQRVRTRFAEELGIEPGAELRDLERRVLAHDPALDGGRTGKVAVPSNLPAPRTNFVGRESEVAALVDLVAGQRLVTLIGVGGAGKTRLAIEVARHHLDEGPARFPDGVFFADLSALTTGVGLIHEVAEALGMPPAGSRGDTAGPIDERVMAFLHDRRVLVILDNCEHLLDDSAELVDRLLVAAPDLSVLATSREALTVEGEHVWPVPPLSMPDVASGEEGEAMQLLVDRIRAVRPGFEIAPHNRDALAEICVRLDGLPLALELAAARALHLTPPEIAQRLTDRFRLLGADRRRAPRQRTLQATIDWSYDLLTDDEQTLLGRLAVFAGDFGLDAAEGVGMAGIDGVGLDLLGSLVEKSLVVADPVDGRTRYRLLETIRLYAWDRLIDAGEADRLRSAHRDWFLERLEAERWDRCIFSESLAAEQQRDWDNLRVALEWCEAQERPDLLRRMLLRMVALLARHPQRAETNGWFDEALEYEVRALPRSDWLVHLAVEWVFMFASSASADPAVAAATLERLEELADDLQGGVGAAFAHTIEATHLIFFPDQAARLASAAEAGAERAGDAHPLMREYNLWMQAIAQLFQQRYDEAAAILEHRDSSIPGAPETLATVRHLRGQDREALELLRARRSGIDIWARCNRVATAIVTRALGDASAARGQMLDVVASIRRTGWEHPLARADCLVGLAALAFRDGDVEVACRLIAAVPNLGAGTPALYVLLRHYRDLVRDELDRETRHRCIEEGRSMTVDEAIDAELARWDAQENAGRDVASD